MKKYNINGKQYFQKKLSFGDMIEVLSILEEVDTEKSIIAMLKEMKKKNLLQKFFLCILKSEDGKLDIDVENIDSDIVAEIFADFLELNRKFLNLLRNFFIVQSPK